MTRHIRDMSWLRIVGAVVALAVGQPASGQDSAVASPAAGYDVHVTAPHVVAGVTMGPYHHYCKVLSAEPVIQCLVYSSSEANARLEQVEYIIAKSITRSAVSLGNWNRNWHDHAQEISTGRVAVLDLPPEKAKEVADLVATTDGIIFHLWSHKDKVPSGKVTIAQSVGHVNLSKTEFAKGAAKKPAP
ncbi:MAG: DUF1264 domain-containing protein [Gemmatimonadaceae bacterium]